MSEDNTKVSEKVRLLDGDDIVSKPVEDLTIGELKRVLEDRQNHNIRE
jgi:hypothetical protein